MAENVADIGDGAEPPPLSPPRRGEGNPTENPLALGTNYPGAQSPLDWEKVRVDFEGDEKTIWAICREYGIHIAVLGRHAKAARWNTQHRGTGIERARLVQMLFSILAREISNVEKQDMTEAGEKALTVLGRLATATERLIELENRAGPATAPEQAKEIQDIRRKLARRIDRLIAKP